ncbi:MAG: hypothetical protein AABX38_01765 [Candidatus Micrarchaeota archaeon]
MENLTRKTPNEMRYFGQHVTNNSNHSNERLLCQASILGDVKIKLK